MPGVTQGIGTALLARLQAHKKNPEKFVILFSSSNFGSQLPLNIWGWRNETKAADISYKKGRGHKTIEGTSEKQRTATQDRAGAGAEGQIPSDLKQRQGNTAPQSRRKIPEDGFREVSKRGKMVAIQHLTFPTQNDE